jgi:hypothetical protein
MTSLYLYRAAMEATVSWFRKACASKPNTGDVMTTQQLGEFLFKISLGRVSSFIASLDSPQLRLLEQKERIDQIELLIAFMWLIFDGMEKGKYAKSFVQMHTCFMTHVNRLGFGSDRVWRLLQDRYNEYRQAQGAQHEADTAHAQVARAIRRNILNRDEPTIDALVLHLLGANIQEQMEATGKVVRQVHLQDK